MDTDERRDSVVEVLLTDGLSTFLVLGILAKRELNKGLPLLAFLGPIPCLRVTSALRYVPLKGILQSLNALGCCDLELRRG